MKKKDFIERVADKAELTRSAAARTVEAIFDAAEGAIVEAIRAGEAISLPGFGKFRTKTRGARKGRNPRTGKEINIPARTVMHFSSGKGVADTLAGKKTARRKSAAKAGAKSGGSKSAAKGAARGGAKSGGSKTAGKSAAKGAARGGSKSAGKSASKGAVKVGGKSAAKGAARSGSKSAGKSAAKNGGRR